MQLSRRGLLGGLVALVAAPAIVRVESLMVLPAPQKLILPETLGQVIRINFPIDYVAKNNLLTLDAYSERILAPIITRMQQAAADAIMQKSAFLGDYEFMQGAQWAKPTPSFE